MRRGGFWSKGYRPFFLGAAAFAAIAMADWMTVYLLGLPLELRHVTIYQWHAHGMIFGYAAAVIAGLLLTIAREWTGLRAAHGPALALLFLLWLLARALTTDGTRWLPYAAAADLAFLAGLLIALGRAFLQVRQRRQAPVFLLLALFVAADVVFWLGAAGWLHDGARLGVYGGLYTALAMVLYMGRRVIPFFTMRGVGYEVHLKIERWVDLGMTGLFPLFMFSELLLPLHPLGAGLAAALLYLNSRRVMGWYTLGIWQKPLLLGLFASFIMVNLGFLLRALMPFTTVPPVLPVHAFALGGIGIITISLMARVTLAQAGRDVNRPPRYVAVITGGMMLAATARIFLPLAAPESHEVWIMVTGVIWIISFLLFTMAFAPLLLGAPATRTAAKPGRDEAGENTVPEPHNTESRET
ncbi:MAG: NnrS family protein [Xanthomonadales bacterium]